MEKKCLIIGYYFYPDSRVGAKRYNLLSNYLSKKIKTLCKTSINMFPEKDGSLLWPGKIFRTVCFPTAAICGNQLIQSLKLSFFLEYPN